MGPRGGGKFSGKESAFPNLDGRRSFLLLPLSSPSSFRPSAPLLFARYDRMMSVFSSFAGGGRTEESGPGLEEKKRQKNSFLFFASVLPFLLPLSPLSYLSVTCQKCPPRAPREKARERRGRGKRGMEKKFHFCFSARNSSFPFPLVFLPCLFPFLQECAGEANNHT